MSSLTRRAARPQPIKRGMSIVELMVGIAIGLFILAGATMVVTGQLGENRRLLADTQAQQDLRTAADIISRDVRKAAYTGRSFDAIWPATSAAGLVDAYAAMTPASAPAGTNQLVYSYTGAQDPTAENNLLDDNEVSGFRWLGVGHPIEIQLGLNNWQALTDPSTLAITGFEFTVDTSYLDVPMGPQCTSGDPACRWLKYAVRDVRFRIDAQSAIDANVTRSISGAVRVRNDIVCQCPSPASCAVCP